MYEPAGPLPVPGEAFQEVRSAEQVALHFPIAGPGTRVLAYAADAVVIVAIQMSAIVILMLTTPLGDALSKLLKPYLDQMQGGGGGGTKPEEVVMTLGTLVIALLIIGQLIVEWAYFMISEQLTGGRSIGKRLVGLRVIGQDGLPLTPRASLVRNLLRAVDVLPGSYVVGLVAIVASPKGQRLGDLAAGTIVVRLDRGAPLDLPIDEPVGSDDDLPLQPRPDRRAGPARTTVAPPDPPARRGTRRPRRVERRPRAQHRSAPRPHRLRTGEPGTAPAIPARAAARDRTAITSQNLLRVRGSA